MMGDPKNISDIENEMPDEEDIILDEDELDGDDPLLSDLDEADEAEQEDPAATLEAQFEALEAQNNDLKDRLMRAAAEMENLRKRTEREIKEARQFAISGFARDMLTATDNLSRATAMLPDDAREKADDTLKSLIDGVQMTEHEMLRLMEKNGVTKIDPKGEKFDPHLHQAMMQIEDADVPTGTIMSVVQVGYMIGERILRPAMVGVSKGGPKKPVEPAPAADNSANEENGGVDKSV